MSYYPPEPPPRDHLWALLALCLIAAFLLGCAPKERIKIVTQEVAVPVMVSCLKPEDVPAKPGGLGTMPLDANAALSLSLVKNFEWLAYGEEADALLRICAGTPDLRMPALYLQPEPKPMLEPIPGGFLLRTASPKG